MARNFDEFDRKAARPVETQPLVTIQRRSTMSLNQAAVQQLGEPPAIRLLYDKDARVIGIRPTTMEDTRGYPIRKQGHSNSYLLAGQAFMRHYKIDVDGTRRYPAAFVDGILEIDLNGPSVDATGPRAPQNATADATE